MTTVMFTKWLFFISNIPSIFINWNSLKGFLFFKLFIRVFYISMGSRFCFTLWIIIHYQLSSNHLSLGHWEFLQIDSHVLLICPHNFLSHSPLIVLGLSCIISCARPGMAFSQRVLVPLTGRCYLETKTWVLGVLIVMKCHCF